MNPLEQQLMSRQGAPAGAAQPGAGAPAGAGGAGPSFGPKMTQPMGPPPPPSPPLQPHPGVLQMMLQQMQGHHGIAQLMGLPGMIQKTKVSDPSGASQEYSSEPVEAQAQESQLPTTPSWVREGLGQP